LHLSPDRIAEYKFVLPPREIRFKFSELIKPIYNIIDILGRKNNNLRQTRDLLLPKLISGKIDVSDLDIDIGASAA